MDDDPSSGGAVDLDREFTCFLCNGKIVQLGYVKLLGTKLRLSTAVG